MLWTAVAPAALSEKAPVDFDKGRRRVTVGKFCCWLLSSLLICVVLHFVSFASFASATVVTVLLKFDTALRFVCHSCFAGAEHRKHVAGAAAREQWDAGMVSNNAHLSGTATVACLLCLHRVWLPRHGFIFLVLLRESVCLCLCRGGTRATQGNTKGEHTRTRPVYRCVVCCMPAVCSLRLFVSLSPWLLCSCLCRLNSQESRIQMS